MAAGVPTDHPEVSFIVAAYNVAPYVRAALDSALAQEAVAVEAVVVDDASSDGTADIVADMAKRDPRIRLVRRTERGGPSIARNEAMARARGAWLAILDADDLLAPERSRRLVDLAGATAADVVADNFERFREGRTERSTMIPRAAEPYAFLVDIAAFLRGNTMFARTANLGYIKAMFRTSFVRETGLRHPEDVFIGEDYHLLLSCLLAGARFVVTSETYYKYRVRDGSISWRMSPGHVDRLLESHARSGIDVRFCDDRDVMSASRGFVTGLRRARVAMDVVESAKEGALTRALATAARHPGAWPLLLRFGGAAALKRLRPEH